MSVIFLKDLENVPICAECIFKDDQLSRCRHPEGVRVDIVTGQKWGHDCRDMRLTTAPCGPKGVLFVKK